MRTLHAAPGNSSENPRRILSTRFLGADESINPQNDATLANSIEQNTVVEPIFIFLSLYGALFGWQVMMP